MKKLSTLFLAILSLGLIIYPYKVQAGNSVNVSKSNQNTGIINPYHPILFSYGIDKGIIQSSFVIGGWKNGKWYRIEDFKLPQDAVNKIKNFNIDLVKGNETYKFYSQSKYIEASIGSKPTFWIAPASGDKCLEVNVKPIKDKKIKADCVFGINGNWNPLPQKSKWLNKNTYSVDLDNDNKNEIISISATKDKKNPKQKDAKCYVEAKGKKILVEEVLVDGIYVNSFNVFTLDLNGDGKQEIITIQNGHNVNVSIGQFIDGKVKKVLEFYQGD
jgi:hypothetical protein